MSALLMARSYHGRAVPVAHIGYYVWHPECPGTITRLNRRPPPDVMATFGWAEAIPTALRRSTRGSRSWLVIFCSDSGERVGHMRADDFDIAEQAMRHRTGDHRYCAAELCAHAGTREETP